MNWNDLKVLLLSRISHGERHVREKLKERTAGSLKEYLTIGRLLNLCAREPLLVEQLLDRLVPHRAAIVGSVPPGLLPHGLVGGITTRTDPEFLRRGLSELDDESLLKWIVDDASIIYGELNDVELRAFFYHLSKLLSARRQFIDLGSGLGKVVMTAAVSVNFDSYVGIELVPYRHNLALQRLANFSSTLQEGIKHYSGSDQDFSFVGNEPVTKEHLVTIPKRIEFILKDLFEADVSRASVIFIYSTCFGSLMHKVSEKIANEAPVGCLVSSTTYQLDHPGLELIRHYPANTLAWTSVRIYRRVGNAPWPMIEPSPLYRENDEEKWKEEARKALSKLA